jgi:hypothetical protein
MLQVIELDLFEFQARSAFSLAPSEHVPDFSRKRRLNWFILSVQYQPFSTIKLESGLASQYIEVHAVSSEYSKS